MHKFKKLIASFIAFIMIFTNIINLKEVYAFDNSVKIKVRIEGNKSTIVPEKEIVVNNFDLKPYKVLKDTKDIKVIHGLIKALESENIDAKDPKNLEVNGGAYLSNINGLKERAVSDKDGWMYYINNDYVPFTLDEGNLKDGDSLVVFFQEDYSKNVYSYFNKSYVEAKVGETIDLKLSGLKYDFEKDKNVNIDITDANILLNNEKFINLGKYITTDKEGNVKLKFDKEGVYNISAERIDKENGRRNISRPYCKILIKDGQVSEVNKDALKNILDESEKLLLKEVGNSESQYSKEAKEALQKSLEEGKIIFNKENVTSEEVNIEVAKLQNSLLKFKNSIKKDENLNSVISDVYRIYEEYIPNNFKNFDFITTMALRRAGMETDILSKKMNIYGMDNINNDSRNIMTIIGAGKNPKNYKDKDYTKNIVSYNYKSENNSQTIAKAIIAMDMAEIPYNKEEVIGSLLGKAHKEEANKISFGIITEGYYDEFLGETTEDEYTAYIDNTAWALIALSSHKDMNGVRDTINGIKNYLKSKQNKNGLIDNSGDTALVIQGLIALGENPLDDYWKVNNGEDKISLLDAILSCKVERGFSQKPENSSKAMASDISTPQVLGALVDINTMTSMYKELRYAEEDLPIRIELTGENNIYNGAEGKLNFKVFDFNNLVIKNPAVAWKTSDDTIATVENGVVNGLKEGSVEITAYIIGNEKVKESKTINIIAPPNIDYSERLKDEIEFLKKHYEAYGNYEFLASPSAILSGISKEEVQNNIYRYSKNNTVLQNAKIIIALLGSGLNPRNDIVNEDINNYVETLEKSQVKDGVDKGKFIINKSLDEKSIEAQSYALIALDLAKGNFDREGVINQILNMLNDPNYTKEESYKNIKTEAIALTALSRYKNMDNVKFKVQDLLKFIKDSQNSDGAFDIQAGSNFKNSPIATGAVVQALLANDIDPLSWNWTKKGTTMIDGLVKSKFIGRTDSTSGYSQGEGLNFENSESSYYAFAAFVQMLNKKSIFNIIEEEQIKAEKEQKEKLEREQREREEKEKQEKEQKEQREKEEKEKQEREQKEKEEKERQEKEQREKAFNGLLESISNNVIQNNLTNNWYSLSLNRLGKKVPSAISTDILNKVKNSKGQFDQITDCEKLVLSLLAIGEDPRNIYGYDLVSKIYDDYMDQGINAYTFGLLALDSGNFNISQNSKWNRDKLIKEILDNKTMDNGWSFVGYKADPDMTGMVLSALAPYYNEKAEVKKVIDKTLEMLSNIQDKDGGYSSWGNQNSNSISMVIIGLSSLGIDITKDNRFIKNGNTLLDALYRFKTEDGKGFGFVNKEYNELSTEQGLRALVSYKYLKENKGSIYKFKYIPKATEEEQIREEKEKQEREKQEKEEKERQEKEQKEKEEKEKQEREDIKDNEKSKPVSIKNNTGAKEFKLGTDAKIKIEATNNSKETKNTTLIVGLYDKNNKMINYVAVNNKLRAGENIEMNAMMSIPSKGSYKIKAFVWDTLEDMNTLSKDMEFNIK